MSDTIGKINIDNISKFAELMMDLQDTGYCPMFCKYDVARNLIKELIRHGADIRYILLDDNDGGGYTKEFEVGLVDNEIVGLS